MPSFNRHPPKKQKLRGKNLSLGERDTILGLLKNFSVIEIAKKTGRSRQTIYTVAKTNPLSKLEKKAHVPTRREIPAHLIKGFSKQKVLTLYSEFDLRPREIATIFNRSAQEVWAIIKLLK